MPTSAPGWSRFGWATLLALGCGKTLPIGSGVDGEVDGFAGSGPPTAEVEGGSRATAGGASVTPPAGGGSGGLPPAEEPTGNPDPSGSGTILFETDPNGPCAPLNGAEIVTEDQIEPTRRWATEEACDAVGAQLEQDLTNRTKLSSLDAGLFAGTWGVEGELELVLDAQGNGTLMFGEEVSFSTPADPSQPYLSDVAEDDATNWQDTNLWHRGKDGFRYSVHATTLVEFFPGMLELGLGYVESEPWSDWCAQLAPVRGPECYACDFALERAVFVDPSCEGYAGCYTASGNRLVRRHCAWTELCFLDPVCACTSERCFANPHPVILFQVVMVVEKPDELHNHSVNAFEPTPFGRLE